jgi:transmembrane sensor
VNDDLRIAEEAAGWIDRINQFAIDVQSGNDFDAWMNADPRHREAYAELLALWHSDILTQALSRADVPPAQSEALSSEPGSSTPRWRIAPWLGGALAASLLMLLLAVQGMSFRTYRTGPGAGERVQLADGSAVDLSGNAELQVRILPWRRSVTLGRGEAFFDVRHEAIRAFRVTSGSTTVSVLGTAFNVDRQDTNRTIIEVYRGAVELDVGASPHRILRKGEGARVVDGHISTQPSVSDAGPEWKSGWFDATNVPLGVLISKVQRYSKRSIIISEKGLADIPISGRFHIADTDRVLAAIDSAYGVTPSPQRGTITLSRPIHDQNQ